MRNAAVKNNTLRQRPEISRGDDGLVAAMLLAEGFSCAARYQREG